MITRRESSFNDNLKERGSDVALKAESSGKVILGYKKKDT